MDVDGLRICQQVRVLRMKVVYEDKSTRVFYGSCQK